MRFKTLILVKLDKFLTGDIRQVEKMANDKRKLNEKDQGSNNPPKRRRSAASKEIDYNDDKDYYHY